MRPGWSVGFILRFYSCLKLLGILRLPSHIRGFPQLGRKGPHLGFVIGLRERHGYGASKSVLVRKPQYSGDLRRFSSVDSELGDFGSSWRNEELISPDGSRITNSETGEKGKARRISKPEGVNWVVPSVSNTNGVEYSAGTTHTEGSTSVVGDPFDGDSPALEHQDIDGGGEEEKKCGTGVAAFHNASAKEEVDSLTSSVLGEDQVGEEQRRAYTTHHQKDSFCADGGSTSSFPFSLMQPVGKNVGFLGEKATYKAIKSEILRNRAILMQAKADDLQESASRIVRILNDRGMSESCGVMEDTWPYRMSEDDRGALQPDIIYDDRPKAALFTLTATEKECNEILDILFLVLKEDNSDSISNVQKERLILFQRRIKQLKEELEVYRTKISQLDEWEVEAKWMRQDLSKARNDLISAETSMKGLKARHAKDLQTLEAELAAQQSALAGFKLRTFSVERQSQKTQRGLESELKRYQEWNTLLVEELEDLKMKHKSDNRLDRNLLRRQQHQKLGEGNADHHQNSRHDDDEELILALKTQEQNFKDSAQRKRRLHLKEVQELKDQLDTQRKKHKHVMERILEQWQSDVSGLKEDAEKLKQKYHSSSNSIVVSPSEPEVKFRTETRQLSDIIRLEQTLRCLEMSGI